MTCVLTVFLGLDLYHSDRQLWFTSEIIKDETLVHMKRLSKLQKEGPLKNWEFQRVIKPIPHIGAQTIYYFKHINSECFIHTVDCKVRKTSVKADLEEMKLRIDQMIDKLYKQSH